MLILETLHRAKSKCSGANDSMVAIPCYLRLHQILFADRRLIRAKFGMPYQTNGFINHESSSKSNSFTFIKAGIAEVYSLEGFDISEANGGIVDPSWFGLYCHCRHSLRNSWKGVTKKELGCWWDSCFWRISSDQGFIKLKFPPIKLSSLSAR